ncbi:Ig-like domain-containing protein [Hyalangium versicolor]|uniref:Ig-like domain-containing protein n=1 Tax=Hyalangium versicolor TaxID=2861190 RepID=UPI001CCA59D6|nr:Ig-like domain-containing protein [Hyalangium versicolor]
MVMRNWVQALCAAVCVLALAGCGDECVDKFDCQSDKGNPPEGKQWICNADNKCEAQSEPIPEEPKCTPTCAAGEFCDTSSGTGVCRTCSGTQGCNAPLFCDVAANNGKGVCKACTDSATSPDTGCSAGAPICDTSANNGVGVCKACADTSTTGTDEGCSATAPVCDTTAGNGAGACKACSDTATGNGTDLGCSDAAPLCDASANSGAGTCKACTDSATGNGTDLGCSATAPICNASAANGAGACKACTDSATGNATDLGCSDTAPICNATAANGVGLCKACVDSASGGGTDLGCSAAAPLCDSAASNGAGACKVCADSASGGDTDVGCSASAPICDASASNGAGVCKTCADTATGNATDQGCSSGAPICDTTAANGAGVCKVCLDTASSGNGDLGCSAPTSLCDPLAANGVGACYVCLTNTNEGCPGVQTCNATGTACEGCVDNSSCTNASTPYCKPPPPVAVCVECIDDTNCSPAHPVCSTTSNFCGCANDAACANAAGNTTLDFCDTAANNGRGECKVCVTDANCASADAARPYCENQTACIGCRSNADCSLSQVCDASKTCVAPPGADPAGTSAQIQSFIDAPVGALTPPITIENAFVTYIKPALGTDVAGFFLQAEANGPAMFVASDSSSTPLQVGDRVTLTVGEVVKLSGDLEAAADISGFTVVARGYPVQNLNTATPPGLTVERSGANDLQSNLAQYESELLSLSGTLASNGSSSGTGHVSFTFTTTGVPAAQTTLVLRVASTVADSLGMAQTCKFTLKAGPMWRFTSGTTNTAQPSAYYTSDLTVSNCPAPKLLTAVPSSLTQVVLNFDRYIDPASVSSSGAQFTFTNGLTATQAQVNGKQITLTTSAQTAGASYTVTVANSVKDLLGTPVSGTANTATFKGYRVTASLLITEVLPNGSSSTDLVELLAVSGGNVEGFVLQQDINSATTLATLPNVTVATGDIIVVHMTPPNGYASETTAKNQFPASGTAINYDTAWDFAGNAAGITYSNRVLLIKDAVGTIQDATPFVKTDVTTPPSGFPANLQAIQAAGLWSPADCGGALCTYTTTPTAQAVSADWTTATGTSRTSNTVRRISATDTNTGADWAVGAQSWGLPNP